MLYGSENRTIKATDTRRTTATKMKCMRKTARQTWTDCNLNTDLTKELKVTPVLDRIQHYKVNRLRHMKIMPRKGLPRIK